ncbi:hypothetical protein ACWOC1_05350 [Enterococcus quebecensis]|uniref:Uncharacterized protein n=1 Tax=Enterococcus quebecensis TaxID=903983 RepID=A0A1E5GVG1_9ENTE|nr:hypothetical protein [Enterococcus quebecensis]OEG16270.1 hypothetical protein BCR23_05115 [Enterococcus quebecensis]OJG74457.1 hypothetical protein RV12_GL002514 [Enterococcus quebecensis]
MKKTLLVASCLVTVGLFAMPEGVSANEVDSPSISLSPQVRALADIREVTLKPGEYMEYNVGGFSSVALGSKFTVKFKIDSNEPETVVVDRFGNYQNQHRYSSYFEYGTHGTINFNNLEDNLPSYNLLGKERIRVMNASATTLNFTIGLSSGIHQKSQECVDYSNIDFNL